MAKKPRLVRGRDYEITDDGAFEITREYLESLGACCSNQCRNCPYANGDASHADAPQQQCGSRVHLASY